MAKLMMNGTQVGGTNGSASSVTCENGKTVEERLNSLDTVISGVNSSIESKLSKTGGTVTGSLAINSGDNDTPNIIFISPSYGEMDIDFWNDYFRIYKAKNGTITFPFQIHPDGSLYSQNGKIVDASCFSYSNGTLNINI